MLDMGFFDDIADASIKQCPKERQTLLFSATYPEGIKKLSAAFMREPKEVKLLEAPTPPARSASASSRCARTSACTPCRCCSNHYRPVSTLAFCNTKRAMPRPGRGAARAGLRGAGAARRPRPARPRPGAGALRQPQLQRAGGHRRRRARPRHRAARGRDQRRHHARRRHPHPPHRPHRPGRRRGLGLQPGQPGRDGPRRRDRTGRAALPASGSRWPSSRRQRRAAAAADGDAADPGRAQGEDPRAATCWAR